MYKRILVPLDGSHFSEEIIPHAVGLAAIHGTELVLVRVVDEVSDEDEAAGYVNRLAPAHGAHGLCLLKSGDVAHALLKEANRKPATLLAMTTRGHSGFTEVLLGSVAQRVMRSAKGSILMYHPTGANHAKHLPIRPRSVVLPLDGTPLSEAMTGAAAEFARWINAELEVVSVLNSVRAADVGETSEGEMVSLESGYVRSRANQIGKQYGVQINWEVLHGDAVEAIVDHVADRHDAILAMATRREDALEATLRGSVTAGCLRQAGVPVLVRLP